MGLHHSCDVHHLEITAAAAAAAAAARATITVSGCQESAPFTLPVHDGSSRVVFCFTELKMLPLSMCKHNFTKLSAEHVVKPHGMP